MSVRVKVLGLSLLCAVMAIGLVPACATNQLEGTAAYLSMSFGVAVDQLVIQATVDGGKLVDDTPRPVSPSKTPLASPQSVHVLLPQNTEGPVLFYVAGKYEGRLVANGEHFFAIKRGYETSGDVTLVDGAGCGECTGCCDAASGTCVTASKDACGSTLSGVTYCKACGIGADGCSSEGTCTCGGGAVCGTGLACENGACVCNQESCTAGCCLGSSCIYGSNLGTTNCGAAGLKCEQCPAANACLNGVCQPACTTASCPTGCCSGSTCLPATADHCGKGGDACVLCPSGATCKGNGVCG